MSTVRLIVHVCAALLFATSAHAQVTLTQGTNFSVDAAHDGRMAIDLLGGIWLLPPSGGSGTALATGPLPAARPRWSPDAASIVFQAGAGSENQLWLYDLKSESVIVVSDGAYFDQHPEWHPDGRRVTYSSDRADSGFDLWETDLPSKLSWRITHLPGDETEPAWSADGRDLVYIHYHDQQWSLMLRRLGQPDTTLLTSPTRLSSPSWRPDGSLITFIRHSDLGLSIDMVILSEPLLIRPLIRGEDFFDTPVAWLDRQQMLYAANGVIRKRQFNSRTSTKVSFRATVIKKQTAPSAPRPQRDLPVIDAADSPLVIRVGRLFDGLSGTYQEQRDIVINNGVIAAIEDQLDRPDSVVLNFGNLTAVPGFIDSYAGIPANASETLGPLMLSYGVTTIVAEHANSEALNKRWSGRDMPGPRLLSARSIYDVQDGEPQPWLITIAGDMAVGTANRDRVANWQALGVPVMAENLQAGIGSGASMLLGADAMPASPGGQRYNDIQLTSGANAITIVSGLADARTPGLETLLQSRQARLFAPQSTKIRQFAAQPQLSKSSAALILGSKPNGLPPGLALQAELRALANAGLKPVQALRATGTNASSALGVGLQLGRIVVGGKADIVLIDGDPLADINDTRKIAGVVRNGRFYSAIGLIERAETPAE